jgi:FMN reductase
MAREIKILSVVGNPKAGSRTLQVAGEVALQIRSGLASNGIAASTESIDLAVLGAALMDWESPVADAAVKSLGAADLLIVASPTYKATYAGLLKLFLDRLPYNGLAGRTAVPVMVAAAPIHALAVELHLRPLLVELGASCPTRGLAVLESQLPEVPVVIAKWLEGAMASLTAALATAPERAGQPA